MQCIIALPAWHLFVELTWGGGGGGGGGQVGTCRWVGGCLDIAIYTVVSCMLSNVCPSTLVW